MKQIIELKTFQIVDSIVETSKSRGEIILPDQKVENHKKLDDNSFLAKMGFLIPTFEDYSSELKLLSA